MFLPFFGELVRHCLKNRQYLYDSLPKIKNEFIKWYQTIVGMNTTWLPEYVLSEGVKSEFIEIEESEEVSESSWAALRVIE